VFTSPFVEQIFDKIRQACGYVFNSGLEAISVH
jgi:hypothetical protein